MEEKKYEITEGLLNGILGYLGNRPYVEVAQMISNIMQATQPPPQSLSVVPFKKDGKEE